MFYRCKSCGHLFQPGSESVWTETHGFHHGPYEKLSGCPICKSGYQEAYQCKKCGDWRINEELYSGLCEKCLSESITYETFFEYCEENKDFQYLETLIIEDLLDMDAPADTSDETHNIMIFMYNTFAEEVAAGTRKDFLPDCIRFIMEDDGSIGRENYAEWMNKREVK